MIRPDNIHAITNAAVMAAMMKVPLQRRLDTTDVKATSIGSPTDTSQGTACAVDEPVMRATPSDHVAISLISLAARCLAMWGTLLRSRPIQFESCAFVARPMPLSLTILTTLPA